MMGTVSDIGPARGRRQARQLRRQLAESGVQLKKPVRNWGDEGAGSIQDLYLGDDMSPDEIQEIADIFGIPSGLRPATATLKTSLTRTP